MLNMKLKPTGFNVALLLVLAAVIIIFGPFAVIWSLNTLFPVLAIEYTFDTWLAVFLINLFLKSAVSASK